jgi:hypothetical protein
MASGGCFATHPEAAFGAGQRSALVPVSARRTLAYFYLVRSKFG